jgi:phosphate transport system permease protein
MIKFDFLYWRRKMLNRLIVLLSCLAMAFGLFFLGAILYNLISNGWQGFSVQVFTLMTPPPGEKGGLLNAIFGSLVMTSLGTVIGAPIGILAGTYLAESQPSKMISVIKFVNDILLSAPSVVIGFFVYAVVVARLGHFSAWAGALALAIILIPIVCSQTENMLRLVPVSLREAAAALGAPRWKMIVMVVYRSAKSGILTGILLGLARISGETAPLLFTALNNQFWSTDLSKAMSNLPVVIFQFAMSPYDDWRSLAWVGALLITLTVLLINIVARIFLRKKRRSA